MIRGTFANVRVRNEMTPERRRQQHACTMPDGERMSIFDAAERYREEGVPLVVVAGAEYGAGSSRDWAAKGTRLLGVRAVIAESFERIHRSNLVGMGVLPLQFPAGVTRKTLELDGDEAIDIDGISRRAGAAQRARRAPSRAPTAARDTLKLLVAPRYPARRRLFPPRRPAALRAAAPPLEREDQHESKEKTARAARAAPGYVIVPGAYDTLTARLVAGRGVRRRVSHRRRLFARQRLSRHRAAHA